MLLGFFNGASKLNIYYFFGKLAQEIFGKKNWNICTSPNGVKSKSLKTFKNLMFHAHDSKYTKINPNIAIQMNLR